MFPPKGIAVERALAGISAIGEASGADILVIGLLLVGLLCQCMHRRLPAGLGTSLFVGATTLSVALATYHYHWPYLSELSLVSRVTGALCALWAFFGWLAGIRGAGRSAGAPPSRIPAHSPTSSPTFFAWSLITGITAGVVTIYIMVFATWSRLLDREALVERLTAAGFWDLLLLVLAVLFWTVVVARPQQPVMLLILTALIVWWTGLMIPPGIGSFETAIGPITRFQPNWWTWTLHVQAGLALLLVLAAVLQESRYRARRRQAWPDNLDDLIEPYSRWPAYIQTESVIAAAILILGVYQIVQYYPISWKLNLANSLVAFAAGIACMFMAYRRWSGNTIGLGIALVTLAFVAMACLAAIVLAPLHGSTEYAVRIPILDNAVLLALAAMVLFWSWLAVFWEQQLRGGVAWTTAGRSIPHARRAAFMLTALAVLVAFRMALWPRFVFSHVEDAEPGRLIAGVGVLLLFAFIVGRLARREGAVSHATLCVAFVIAAVLFVLVRLPASALRGWLIQYEPVILSFLCLPILVAAEALDKSRWRSFSPPLWFMALLILPLRILILLLPSTRLPAEWIRPLTLAIMGALYAFAGSRENRRAILVLGSVFLLAALSTFYSSYKSVIIPLFSGGTQL